MDQTIDLPISTQPALPSWAIDTQEVFAQDILFVIAVG